MRFCLSAFLWGCLGASLLITFMYLRLPDINELRDVRYQQPLRIYTSDGALITQIGVIQRTPIAYDDIPEHLINALLSAEDARFFSHIGLDFRSLARAVLQLVTASPNQTGASTITMQVARNYYLTRERTIIRKLNEIFLAVKMERAINKEEIMSLYVNTIFLGFKSHGFAAAAQTYYNADLKDLTLAQYAMLAALPKAPSGMNPVSNPDRARQRRDWILGRMATLGYVSQSEYLEAIARPLTAKPYDYSTEVEGLYLSEAARLEVEGNLDKYGVDRNDLYTAGYKIYTTADSRLQRNANKAVRNGLLEYDKRHGWRGIKRRFGNLTAPSDFNEDNPFYVEALRRLAAISSYDDSLEPSIVKDVVDERIRVVLSSGEELVITKDGWDWAAPYISDQRIGRKPQSAKELVAIGDMVRITPLRPNSKRYRISQVPRAEGALLAVDPNSGLIRAMVGGYHFQLTKYNRAMQARRQIGSAIKPFLYAAALESGYNGADIFKDSPFVSDSSSNLVWRPSNAGDSFLGDIPLREALYRSRNLVSVRLMRALGVSRTRAFMGKFGLPSQHLPSDLSLALGSAELTLPEVIRAYSVFANGGYLIEPRLILRVENAEGDILYRVNELEVVENQYMSEKCKKCDEPGLIDTITAERILEMGCHICFDEFAKQLSYLENEFFGDDVSASSAEVLEDFGRADDDSAFAAPNQQEGQQYGDVAVISQENIEYRRIISPELHYQINSILQDVVKHGTATRAKALGRSDLAGKTGTTQNYVDAWFVGYNPDLVAVSWVGFDTPGSLGSLEYGGRAALPIWQEFFGNTLGKRNNKYFFRPENLVQVNVTIVKPTEEDRSFYEYVNVDHLEEYLDRVARSDSGIEYYYTIDQSSRADLLNITEEFGSSPESQKANREKSSAVKKLF